MTWSNWAVLRLGGGGGGGDSNDSIYTPPFRRQPIISSGCFALYYLALDRSYLWRARGCGTRILPLSRYTYMQWPTPLCVAPACLTLEVQFQTTTYIMTQQHTSRKSRGHPGGACETSVKYALWRFSRHSVLPQNRTLYEEVLE